MNESDQEYIQEKMDGFLDDEYLIKSIKRFLRVHITRTLRKKDNIRFNLLEDENIAILFKLIHEFLDFYEINNTCKMLEEECADIFQMNIKGFDDRLSELGILNDGSECNTKIETLLQNKLISREKREIDEVTNTVLIEASNCIESLQDEIKTLHNVYFEQVNAAREVMERKVSNIEKLYLESISRND
ncbi:uncharacterized protein ELE39_001202 [Cryptosporidium sp. chipmunk genotype I]|uniref:uncharacterized protein n=1 Tax=Cryptosporidium sp. chipmunk genotype I TaxID=1280935 RepID=UPI00351A13CE|nr:hypothetical protein ELE39_001202 [Cryptosporidium sp. chipmunk genotype I]